MNRIAGPSPARAGLVAGALAFALYLSSNHPQPLAHDAAQFQTLAATGGIAHAGYPLLVMLLEWFGRIPLSTIAWRANLLSCLSGALAVGLAAHAAARLTGHGLAAIAGALALALSMTMWLESTRAGVHAFTLAVGAGVYLLAVRFQRLPQISSALALGVLYGFGLVSHLTILALAPVVAAAIAIAARARRLRASHVAAGLAGLTLGLLPLGYMIARDRPDQPMNYIESTLDLGSGQYLPAETPPLGRWQRAAWLLSARQYLAHTTFRPFEDVPYRLRLLVLDLGLNEFPLLASALALAGIPWLLRRAGPERWLLGLWLAAAAFLVAFAAARGMLAIFFLPGAWVVSLLVAAGVAALAGPSRARALALLALLVAIPLARLAMPVPPPGLRGRPSIDYVWEMWPRKFHPWRADATWEQFGRGVMAALPPRSVVLSCWEEGMSLSYARFAARLRDDVEIRLSCWDPRRVRRELALAERDARPVYSTFDPTRTGLAWLRWEASGEWPRGRLWRIDRGREPPR